jgi:formylglycine-generating enzyme required for sulfatase activity
METIPFKYRAFLSYSHRDTGWAKWLHARLEAFRIHKDLIGRETPVGPVPNTLRPIFRDRDDFAGGHTLTEATITALDASAVLIVLCSTGSAGRPTVNEEVRLFRARHPERPVIPVIIDGTWPDNFPPALRFELAADGTITDRTFTLLGPDLRENADGKNLGLAKTVAGLTGLAPDDVYRRAERQRRRRRFQALAGVLTVGAIGLAGWLEHDELQEAWRRWWIIRPFMQTEVRPFVLTAAAERAKKSGESFRECAVESGKEYCPEMIVVPAGNFIMGSPMWEKGHRTQEEPQHPVSIPWRLAVSRFDITFDQWEACVAFGDCLPAVPEWEGGRQPVINVSWYDAQDYVAWLSRMSGKPYRLLTEAEWEYAARATTTTAYYWGDEVGTGNANCKSCGSTWDNRQASPVGSFRANAFGLYDMAGNAWQWVDDCWNETYEGAPTRATAWDTKNCKGRVVRGGSWYYEPQTVRTSHRTWASPDARNKNFSFRVARTIESD